MPKIVEICDITYKGPNACPVGTIESGMELEQVEKSTIEPVVVDTCSKIEENVQQVGIQSTVGLDLDLVVDKSSNIDVLGLGQGLDGEHQPIVGQSVVEPCSKIDVDIGLPEMDAEVSPQDHMLNYLANSKTAYFKSQQTGEPELDFNQKRQIACDVLTQSPGQFLARFGQHLKAMHLDYFTDIVKKTEDYEVAFRIKQLSRFHCKTKRQLDVRNRRFVALKKLIASSTYFDEIEMKKRNPLLYEDLIGKYLTQKEIEEEERYSSGAENATLVDILLNQIERDQIKALRESQLQAEEEAREEVDTSDEDDDDDDDDDSLAENESVQLDEEMDYTGSQDENQERPERKKMHRLSSGEKGFWKGEFFSRMCDSFLEGKDKDFDYSQVDDNIDYDNLADRAIDEEEKYFDSETPDTFVASTANSDTEDELDVFMKSLKPDPSPHELSDQLERM